MFDNKTIGFIGSGNLAEALINGLIASEAASPGQILAADRVAERLVHLAETYEVKVCSKNFEVARSADIIFITVKPADVDGVLKEIAPEMTEDKLLISVAAGITTGRIIESLNSGGIKRLVPVIRAMPNTPVIVRNGVTVITAGAGAGGEDIELAEKVFGAVGKVLFLEDESLMDAVTGLSGSGPAYIFLFMEALIEAGVKAGIPGEKALSMVLQTVAGSARLALESGKDLAELRRMVTSPGGTTAEGVKRLEDGGLKKIVKEAVIAAAKRSRELSSGS